ncbi:MAG: phage tail protein [Gammaproteobacteria bacterium]
MLTIDVRADIERAVRSLTEIQRAIVPKASARALNKTASQAKTQAAREIRTHYNISTRVIGRHIELSRATPATLVAALKATGDKLPVIAFQARQTKRGVTVQIKRGRRRLIPHAFIATLRSGHKGVFARGKYQGRSFVHRSKRVRPYPKPDLPIAELHTVGVPQGFSNRVVLEALERKIRERFPPLLAHEIAFALSRA